MALEMRPACAKRETALVPDGEACVCSYECIFCTGCNAVMNAIGPNCGGELVPRPRRTGA
jgi:hypothetical protein